MAKGIKLKKSWRPGAHTGSIYDEVDDNNGLPHQQFMSPAIASLRLRRDLMDSSGDNNFAVYNTAFRLLIETESLFTAAPAEESRFAEANQASDDLAFCKKLDHELAVFEQTLQNLINSRTATHEEVDRLVAVYLERLTEQFQNRQEAAYEKTWWQRNISEATLFADTALSTQFGDLYPFKTADTEAIRRLDPSSAAVKHIQKVSGYLNKKINNTRRLDDSLRLDLTRVEARATDDPEGGAVNFSSEQTKDLEEIQQLNRRYEQDLFKAMSDLDNSALTINNLNVVHEVYQRPILDKIDAFERKYKYTLWCDQTASVAEGLTTTHKAELTSKLSLVAQQRFAEIREHSLALRVRQNQQFMAPKSTLQDFRYGWDQDHKTKYDDATTGKAATFKVKADACYSALKAPELTTPPPATVMPTPPIVTLPLARTVLAPMSEPLLPELPLGTFRAGMKTDFHKKMQDFEKAKPEEKAGQHALLVLALQKERDILSRAATVCSVPAVTTYLDSCQAYLDYHSPRAIAERLDEQVDDLQSRIVALLDAAKVNDTEVAAITKELTALASLSPSLPNLKIEVALLEVAKVDNYLKAKQAAVDAEKLPDNQVDALQRRINALAEAYQGDSNWIANEAEAEKITKALEDLRPAVALPERYNLHTLAGDPSVIAKADYANSFVKLTETGKADTVYFVDEGGTPTKVDSLFPDFSNRFPAEGAASVELKATEVQDYLPPAQAAQHALDTKIAEAIDQVTAVQAYYPLARFFKNTAASLTRAHEEYAAAARQLLDIEFNFEPTSARQQLDELAKTYTAKCEEELKNLKAKIEGSTGEFSLTVEQKNNFNAQYAVLEDLQKAHLAAATKEVQTLRADADATFARFNRNYQWFRLIEDPNNHDSHYKLTEEQKKKLLDEDSDPKKLLERLLPPGGDAELQVGFMTLRRNRDGTFDIDLSDAFSGKGELYEYGGEGKVSFATAIRTWWSSGERSRDIEATLTDPRRLDNLGLILQGIKDHNTNSIYHHCKEYDKDAFNKMKAVFLAAKAQGIGYDLEACFAKSFHYRRTWYGMKVKISPQEKAALLQEMRDELAQHDVKLIDSKAINQSCRDLTLHGMQPGSPNLAAVTVQDFNSKDFMTAVLLLSHADTSLKGRLATPALDRDTRIKMVYQSLEQLRNLNLQIVRGITPAGGPDNGSSAAMFGLALEREHFVSLLDLKKQELATIRAEIKRLGKSNKAAAEHLELEHLDEAANKASQTLDQEYIHFNQLCHQYGCQVDRAGREVAEQLVDRRLEVERRDVTVSGRNKKVERDIVDALSSLEADKPIEALATLKQQAVALGELEDSHALFRSSVEPEEKPLLGQLLSSAELAQFHRFIEESPIKERADTLEARLCAARQEIAAIDAADKQALADAENTLAALPGTTSPKDIEAAQATVERLKAEQAKGLNAHVEAAEKNANEAGCAPEDDPAVKQAQLLQQYQKLDTNWQQARAELTAVASERSRLHLKGVDPESKEAKALDERVVKAKDGLKAIESQIKALPQPASLIKLCETLVEAQKKARVVQASWKQSVQNELDAHKSCIEPTALTDEQVYSEIKNGTLKQLLGRIEAVHQSIIDLRQLVTVTPEQDDQKRLLLKSALLQYHEVMDLTKLKAISILGVKAERREQQAVNIDTLAMAAKILSHSDPTIRSHVQDDHRIMRMAEGEAVNLQAEHDILANTTPENCDKFALALLKIVDPNSLPQATLWHDLQAALKSMTAPAFSDRAGVFNWEDRTNKARADLGALINLENQIKAKIATSATSATSAAPVALADSDAISKKARLESTLKQTQAYRAALVRGLTADAVRVLNGGDEKACRRVQEIFKSSDLHLEEVKAPISPAMERIGKSPATVVSAIDARLSGLQNGTIQINTQPDGNRPTFH